MYKLFFLLALVAFVAVFAVEDAEKDLTPDESVAFGYYRPWGTRFYGRYGYDGYPYYRTLGYPRYYNGLYL